MRELQERREAAAKPLVDILAKRSRLLEQLAELDEPYGKAYVDAEAAGWTAEDLAKLGADEPVKRPRKRSRSAGKRTGGQSSETADAGSSPARGIPAQDSSATADEVTSAVSV
ncbi:hypothetical protein GA0115245_14656 [Streptomyces sp. di188]|nr:hypothetical protein GA0115238_10405 [Streptomyces sp. di50b]SCE53685.1 hypothetical protein GA0115245_14656 [Streptomyces sp. di188]